MLVRMYAVKDIKADAFMQPFVSANDGSALRGFTEAVNGTREPGNPIHRFPEDHVLYRLATWDDNTGSLSPEPAPFSLGVGTSYIKEFPNGKN